jgi:hypothetical protein
MTTRAERAADQETVARHLVEAVRQRFAGEDITRAAGWEPNERVVLGVLDPRESPLAPPSHPDLPDEPGVPVDVLPPSELGVTVWVDAPGGATHAEFDVDVSFSMYLPEYPTWPEQRAWMTGRAADALDDTDAEPRSDDEDVTVGDDSVVEQTAVGPSDEPAGTGAGAGRAPDADETGSDNDGDGHHGAHTGARSGRSVRFAPVFARSDVTATLSLSVPLPGGVISDGGVVQAALTAAVAARSGRLAYLLQGRAKTGISRAALDAGEYAYEAEIAERRTDQPPPLPSVEFLASTTPDPRGGWRVNLTLANTATTARRRDKPGQTIYNAWFAATLRNGSYRNFGYRLSDRDWRTDPAVYAHGRFCVGEVDGNVVRTNTWPIFRDRVFESRPELQPSFQELIDDPIGVLQRIAERMDTFASDWLQFAASGTLIADRSAASDRDLAAFENEAARFRRGIGLLRRDSKLLAAFIDANQAFLLLNTPDALHPDRNVTSGTPRITTWRLFQIVFIVLGMASLAAREHPDDDLADELATADVLWFPTGGGKSEAFLGLVATALFYDRLRGKHIGTSALIRFPLRMLSVQQLDRVLRLIAACEHVHQDKHPDVGEPFELGYFVGRANTPNGLTRGADDRWGDIKRMASWTGDQRRKNVVITTCPYCRSTNVELVADGTRVRLDHRCGDCGSRIPVVISDDEVYRTLPAVVVATVDKLATIAFQPHVSHLTHGPAFRCPNHGYVTFATGSTGQRRCLARQFCDLEPSAWMPVTAYDPAPAIVIQDELHLLSEDLGTLAAHYETLFAHLCRAGSRLAPKIIAATATISDYENQVRQLYALQPRRFPTEGFREGETFYAARLELPRRLFVGALPSRFDTAQFGIAAAAVWRAELDRLRALPAADCIAELGLSAHTPAEIPNLLFRYELQLFYANRKNDAERAHEQLRRAGIRGPSLFEAEILTGDTPLADISAAIRRVDAENLTTHPDPATRLAAVAGTSLVSHGVDLARLNVLHVAGMPSTNAYYVQATARAGRSDVGVVFTAFSRSFARDRAAFHFFEPQHAYAAQLVEAVSLNRFAVNSPKKTATGMLSAVILNRVARDPALNPPTGHEVTNMLFASAFQSWLSQQPATMEGDLVNEVLEAYGLRAHVLDRVVADYFASTVRRRLTDELTQLRAGTQTTIQKCFLNKPPTSFRDIDEAVEFGAHGYFSGKDFKTLTNRWDRDVADDSEAPIAVEEEEAD